MDLNSDHLLERGKLKKNLRFWRLLAIIVAALFLGSLISSGTSSSKNKTGLSGALNFPVSGPKIAEIKIEGMILNDDYRLKKLAEIAENDNIKALIINVNSPGGSATAGEELFEAVDKIAQKKPVISLFGGMATSAAYMLSLPSQRIYARRSTITGSVGVVFEMPVFKEMAKKLGVKVERIKSGDLKAVPSPTEGVTPASKALVKTVVDEFHQVFMDMVTSKRTEVSKQDMKIISDGRIITGMQAVKMKLADEIGGKEAAIAWLKDKKEISDLPIEEISLEKPKNYIESIVGTVNSIFGIGENFIFKGLTSISQYSGIRAE